MALSMSVSFHLGGTLIDLLDVEPTVETSSLHLLPVPWKRMVMPTMRVECCWSCQHSRRWRKAVFHAQVDPQAEKVSTPLCSCVLPLPSWELQTDYFRSHFSSKIGLNNTYTTELEGGINGGDTHMQMHQTQMAPKLSDGALAFPTFSSRNGHWAKTFVSHWLTEYFKERVPCASSWVLAVDWMFLSSLNSYFEALIPNMIVFRGEAFGRWNLHE